jgi:hypothetical protein
MGLPGYSITNPTVLGDLTLFPVHFTWESDTKGVEEAILRNETQRGVLYEYELYSRNGALSNLVFRFSATQYATFETFINATRAQEFWFVPDSDVLGTKFNVRRNPSMVPKAISPARYSGTLEQRFEWALHLTVLVTDNVLED